MGWMTWGEIGVLVVNQFGAFLMCMFTSFVFVYFLLKILSPKIEISSFISKYNDDKGNGYIFKIINKSKFNAYNVKFYLAKRIPYIVDGVSVNHQLIEIPLIKNEVFSVPAFKKGNQYGDYAVLIGTNVDISLDMGIDHLEYELFVSVAHGLSNITTVTKMRFKKANKIIGKPFEFGNSLKIID